MGGRSAVHPLSPAVAAAAVCTVGCAASTLRRHTGPATAATAPSAGDLRFGAGFRPARHGNCLPYLVAPALLVRAFRCPPFRGCHLFPYLPVAMTVFPLSSHVLINVLYLTCFSSTCFLTGLPTMPPRHPLPRFSFAFYHHWMTHPDFHSSLKFIFLHTLALTFPTFLLVVLTISLARHLH